MGLTNAQKQAGHRARLRANGLVLIHAWATPAQAAAIRAILADRSPVPAPPVDPYTTDSQPSAVVIPVPRRKKKLSAAALARLLVTERNREVIQRHRAEVDRMEIARVSRSELRQWLEAHGADFGGKTTELNALLGPRT